MSNEVKVIIDTSFPVPGFPTLRLDIGRTVSLPDERVLLIGAWAMGPNGQVRMWRRVGAAWEPFKPQQPEGWAELDAAVLPILPPPALEMNWCSCSPKRSDPHCVEHGRPDLA